jgi:hypothetical protein
MSWFHQWIKSFHWTNQVQLRILPMLYQLSRSLGWGDRASLINKIAELRNETGLMKPHPHNPCLVRGSASGAALTFNESGLFAAGSFAVSAMREARVCPVLPPLSAGNITALPVAIKASRKAASNAKRILSTTHKHAGGNK